MTRLIDIGCFNGDSVLHFASNNSYSEIVAFDPNDSFSGIWAAIESRYPHVKFYNGAAYTFNGEVDYTQRPENAPLGSTIMKDKRDWGDGDVKKVKSYDIIDFIVPGTVIKLDGEGSEFDILERIISNGYIKYIPMLYLEWHSSKMTGERSSKYSERQDAILEILNGNGVKIESW